MRAAAIVLALAGAATAWIAHGRADATRIGRLDQLDPAFTPNATAMKVAASGFEEPIADFSWIRATLLFGERFHDAEEVSWRAWLGSMIESTTTLDPQWRTPYHYGGALLRVVGDIDGSTAIFEKCSAELPDDPWCPFSAGMNWFLDKDDPERAAEWVHRAAERPEAPRWWKAAAASMRSRVGGRDAAVRYLDAEIERAASEGELHYLQMKRGRLIHEALVESWEGACRSYREATGENLGSPEDLAQLGFELPPNPRGDAWVVGADGVVRSEEAEAERRKQAIRAEQRLVAKPAEKR